MNLMTIFFTTSCIVACPVPSLLSFLPAHPPITRGALQSNKSAARVVEQKVGEKLLEWVDLQKSWNLEFGLARLVDVRGKKDSRRDARQEEAVHQQQWNAMAWQNRTEYRPLLLSDSLAITYILQQIHSQANPPGLNFLLSCYIHTYLGMLGWNGVNFTL